MLRKKGLFALLLLTAVSTQAQASTGMSNLLFYGLAALAMILFFYLIVSVADNLMVIEGRQSGADRTGANFGLFPKTKELIGGKQPNYLENEPVYKLKKGHDIPMEGKADNKIGTSSTVTRFSIQPPNFLGLKPIPKVTVEVGDTVKAGDTVFYDKTLSRVKFAAPVSGEVISIDRGSKRSITGVSILADRDQQSRSYELPAADASRSELVDFLLESGVWPCLLQRPYNVIADPEVTPRDIFISTFNTAPLAADLNFTVGGRLDAFQAGLDVLNRLTSGIVYLGLDGRSDNAPSAVFTEVKGVQKRYFNGAHPAGNVGVQIHHIHPIGPQDKVWTLDVNGVLAIGELFYSGRYDVSRLVALTGAPLAEPQYVRTYPGAKLGELLKGHVINKEAGLSVRIISGDVLTGQQKNEEQYLNFHDDQVTLITEGSDPELFGWLLPLKERNSISPTIPSFADKFAATTNTHGERRAFVVTNDYEAVMPMDIYTQQLMKAILVNDFETMEGLGIYELVEEDVALAEFACVSKQPLQNILRQGLDVMRSQG